VKAKGRGLGHKGDDTETIPLCTGHHVARHHRTGPFREWKKEQMRDWCARQIVATQARTPDALRCGRGVTRGLWTRVIAFSSRQM